MSLLLVVLRIAWGMMFDSRRTSRQSAVSRGHDDAVMEGHMGCMWEEWPWSRTPPATTR